jgi:hypothetical protein
MAERDEEALEGECYQQGPLSKADKKYTAKMGQYKTDKDNITSYLKKKQRDQKLFSGSTHLKHNQIK